MKTVEKSTNKVHDVNADVMLDVSAERYNDTWLQDVLKCVWSEKFGFHIFKQNSSLSSK